MGSVGTFIRGSGIKRTETISEGIQCVRYGELYTTYTTSFEKTVSFVNEDLANKSKPIQYGDALLTLTGENKQDIGKAVVFLGKERTVIGGDLIQYTNHCFEPLFLSYLLNSPYVVYQKSIASTGDIIVHLSGVKLSNILVAFPPIKEQARIVEAIDNYLPLLSKYDMYNISKSKMDSEIYPLLKKSLLQYAIQGKLVPQDPNDEPVSVLLEHIRTEKEQLIKEGKIKRDKNDSYIYRGSDNSYYEKFADGREVCIDEEIPFDIPESWCWCRVKHISDIKGGKRLPKGYSFSDGITPHCYIRVTDMKNQSISNENNVFISEEVYQQIKNYTISKYDLYITIAGTIGNCGTVPEQFDGMNLTENAVKVTNIKISKEYLLLCLSSPYIHNIFVDKTNVVAQPKLALTRILTTLLPIPPQNEQQRIVNMYSIIIK